MGWEEGMMAKVSSKSGAATLPIHIDKGIKSGHVSIPNGFGTQYPDGEGKLKISGTNVNLLTSAMDRDPFTGIPYHKRVFVNVEKN